MESKMRKLSVVVVLVGVMIQASMELNVDHPMYSALQRVNAKARISATPMLGLILSSYNDEKMLLSSGYFVPDEGEDSTLNFAGRTFKVGTFNGIYSVYAIGGVPLAAVSVTVQLMLHHFKTETVIAIGGGRSIDDRVNVGDVVMPYSSAYSGVWHWEEYEGSNGVSKTPNATLRIGEYNLPEAGENKLGSIKFQSVTRYNPQNPKAAKRTTFWFVISDAFRRKSKQLLGVELQKCLDDSTVCNEEARLHLGMNAASSDIYLENKAYGTFLHQNLGVSLLDKETAAISATCTANGKNFAAFRAVTNKAGVKSDKNKNALATKNSLILASKFAQLISLRSSLDDTITYRYVEA